MRAAAMRHRTFDEDSLCFLVNSKNMCHSIMKLKTLLICFLFLFVFAEHLEYEHASKPRFNEVSSGSDGEEKPQRSYFL